MGKPTTTKRRSMFRSPGTASSPDLATLVRKAKEAKATVPSHVTHDVPQSAYPANPPATLTTSQSSGRVGLPTLSTQTIRGAPVSSDGLPRADQRSASSSSAMPVISERPARSRENSSEGSKVRFATVQTDGRACGTRREGFSAECSEVLRPENTR